MKQEILNELYFGKSLTTQHLQDGIDCLFSLIRNNFNDEKIKKKLIKIRTHIQPIVDENIKEKHNFINGYDIKNPNSTTDHLYNTTRNVNNYYSLKQYTDMLIQEIDTKLTRSTYHKEIDIDKIFPKTHSLIDYNLFILEHLIRMIFGYNMVFVKLTESKIQGEYIFLSTAALIRELKNKKFVDDFGRILETDDVINSINVMNHGMYIDWRKYAVSMLLLVPVANIQDDILTSSELLATIFHEIGHTFSKLLTPHINLDITSRQDEKFADKFVSLYGYSNELFAALAKLQSFSHLNMFHKMKAVNSAEKMKDKKKVSNFIYTQKYEDRKTGLTEKQAKQLLLQIDTKLNSLNKQLLNPNLTSLEQNIIEKEIQKAEETRDDILDNTIDVHPLTYLRMWDQLRQLASELNSSHNTNAKKKKIMNDITKLRQSLRDYHKGNLHSNFVHNYEDSDDFKIIDNEIRKLMHRGDRKNMKIELDSEKDNPLPAEDITNLFDDLHVNTKRKVLMKNNFIQFWKEFNPEDKNKTTNPNTCTELFEKYLVAKYEKYENENIHEYCQRIVRMKIIELAKLKMNIDYKKSIKVSNGVSIKKLSNGIYDTEFQYNKLEDKNYDDVDEFIYDLIIKDNKVFISPCKFNSDEDLESIEYDRDELERIKGIYQKYYT